MLIEVCCGSVDDALRAEAGGAQRVELNSSMFLGGITPSIGELELAKEKLQIPVIAMIRPRGGGFCYTENEFQSMKRDALAFAH
ncbi:MAG: copper homeostasis protein CutC, partial [Spirochaetota bacterium]